MKLGASCRQLSPRAVLSLLLTFVFASNLLAQSGGQGSLKGTVKDVSGNSLGQVRVSVINARQAVIRTVETDSDGKFHVSDIPVGAYVVLASRSDFASQQVSARIAAGETADVALELAPSPLSYTVTVTAETGQAQDKDRVPQQINILTAEDIQQRAKAVLSQVAQEEPGLALQRTSPTISSIFVRGLVGKYVPVYVDGVRYTNSTGRGGINSFFDLNEPSSLRGIEILQGPNSAQYGSDSIGGTVHLITRVPELTGANPEWHGETVTFYTSADNSFGANTLVTYGTRRLGVMANAASRRVNTLRSGKGLDGHAAVTRFFDLPSSVINGSRLPDTAFTQYSGTFHISYSPASGSQIIAHYQRGQQDGGKRYDQLLGGDGNLIANLRNLMGDFFYARFDKSNAGWFDSASLTYSYNSQREERVNQGGQGNALGAITSQYERTGVSGINFHLEKRVVPRNLLLVGGDYYHERVIAPAYTLNPVNNAVTASRPRVPNRSRYWLYGVYLQDGWDVRPGRFRLTGAARYNVASYQSRAANSPLVGNSPLFPNDSLRVGDLSGRAGAVITPVRGVDFAFNYSRGFRAPNITDLGTLGLTGDGFEVATVDLAGLGATVGTTADDKAVSTGIPLLKQRSETSNNFDFSLRIHNQRFDTDVTGFIIDLNDVVVKQALILPPGAAGKFLGDQPIVSQLSNGVVFVPLSSSPVLVRANYGNARLTGIEYSLIARMNKSWSFGGNFTHIHAEDKATGLAPNIEGGTPPPTGFVRLRYAPPRRRFWLEAYSMLAKDQSRLSSLDLSDRRTGATRSRANIANFFARGARVRGLIGAGPDGVFGSADDILLATLETVTQVQQRVLGDAGSVPLFTRIPGYGLINLRGVVRIRERGEIGMDFENIGDKNYRGMHWGLDGPGRSVTVRYRLRF